MAFQNISIETLLGEVTTALREHYLSDTLYENFGWFASNINRIFDFKMSDNIEGADHYWQVEAYKARAARFSRDITAGFSNVGRFAVTKLKATLSETASSSDFSRLDASSRVSLYDLERGAKNPQQFIVNVVPKLVDDLIKHSAESLGIHRMLDVQATLGTVSANAKQNDNTLFASATATPVATGTTGIRVTLSSALIAAFQPGLLVNVYASDLTTLRAIAQVTDYNPIDSSVGMKCWNTTTRATGANNVNTQTLHSTVSTDVLCISGENGLGMISVGTWMQHGTPSPTTLFNVDRTLPANSWMRPTTYRAATSGTASLDKAHIDSLAIAMGYVIENLTVDKGYVALTTPELDQAYRNQIGQQNIVPILPPGDESIVARYGFDSSIYVHPTLGRIALTPDPMAIQNKIMFLRPGDWQALVARKFSLVPAATAIGGFYRVASTTDGSGLPEFQTDYMALQTDICLCPRRQGQISDIAA